MNHKPIVPVCTAFLPCGKVGKDPKTGHDFMMNLPTNYSNRNFPAATPLDFFARCTSGHGKYQVEIQLQDAPGEVVWRDGPPQLWNMIDPLESYNLHLHLCVSFPKPGVYSLVLMLNGDELSRQRFTVQLAKTP